MLTEVDGRSPSCTESSQTHGKFVEVDGSSSSRVDSFQKVSQPYGKLTNLTEGLQAA